MVFKKVKDIKYLDAFVQNVCELNIGIGLIYIYILPMHNTDELCKGNGESIYNIYLTGLPQTLSACCKMEVYNCINYYS